MRRAAGECIAAACVLLLGPVTPSPLLSHSLPQPSGFFHTCENAAEKTDRSATEAAERKPRSSLTARSSSESDDIGRNLIRGCPPRRSLLSPLLASSLPPAHGISSSALKSPAVSVSLAWCARSVTRLRECTHLPAIGLARARRCALLQSNGGGVQEQAMASISSTVDLYLVSGRGSRSLAQLQHFPPSPPPQLPPFQGKAGRGAAEHARPRFHMT